MPITLAQLTSSTPDAYISKLRTYIAALEALINTMTMMMFSDESEYGPVKRAMVESHLEGARNSILIIDLFRQASASRDGLTTAQKSTLEGLMTKLEELEEDLEQPIEELEIITNTW